MLHEYKSGIGNFDKETGKILGVDGEYKLYDCKIVLLLNNVYIN